MQGRQEAGGRGGRSRCRGGQAASWPLQVSLQQAKSNRSQFQIEVGPLKANFK